MPRSPRPSHPYRSWITLALALALPASQMAASPAHAAEAPGFAPLWQQPTTSMTTPPPGRAKEFAFIRANGLFHMFYMRDNLLVMPDSTERDFGHAVSTDLEHWTQLAPVIPIRPGKWDDGHVWAPCVVEQDGVYYMWYVGVTMVPFAWNWYQRIGVATSTDLLQWTRYDEPVFGGHQVPWAYADSSTMDGCQFRDPWVMPDPDHAGQWLMYYVTEAAAARGQLIVGAARNEGGLTPWQDIGPNWATDNAHYWGWVESPCVFQHGSTWYLFVTTTSGHVINYRTAPHPLADSTQWSGKYRLWDNVAQDPQSDYWFGVEHLNVDGHDLLAWVDPLYATLDIQEIVWGTTPSNFTLRTPAFVSVDDGDAPPSALALRYVGRGAGGGYVLKLALPAAADARVEVFDVMGRRTSTVASGARPAGESLVTWDGRDAGGARAARGVYFARLLAGSASRTVRVLVAD